MLRKLARSELFHAQIALFVVIALQVGVWSLNGELLVGPQYVIIPIEILLALVIGFTSRAKQKNPFNHFFSLGLLGLISVVNVSSLLLVTHSLIVGHETITGPDLLGSAIAIFITNIIIFALWYWEIDSPAFTRAKLTKNDRDFQFPQQDLEKDYPRWRAQFLDYLYISSTNAINFAPGDAKPLTHAAKILMGSQALISVFTLALVVARSVSILGS
jgi:uncharacterized membrane protein